MVIKCFFPNAAQYIGIEKESTKMVQIRLFITLFLVFVQRKVDIDYHFMFRLAT